MTNRLSLPQRTLDTRLIVVLRAREATQYFDIIDALEAAGVRSVELTLTTPGTLKLLPKLIERFGSTIDIGVGTVVSADQATEACKQGVAYLVTPISDPDLVKVASKYNTPIIPGGLTPTELHTSWNAGASAVKVFPAGTVGSGYLKDLRGPFPQLRIVPSGGVDLAAAQDWLEAGADAVSVGGPLVGDAFAGGDLESLQQRASQFVAACSTSGGEKL